MKLANYITDLLYRYECVIIPEFGGFVTNVKSAKIDADNHNIQPPFKQITFNAHLKNNDGLLANYIASVDKIKYSAALSFIKLEIENWRNKLIKEKLIIDGIGSFSLINDKILYEPQQNVNYLTSSFGLTSVVSPVIKREVIKKQIVKSIVKEPILTNSEQRNAPSYLKYAAIFVLGLSAVGFGGKIYRDYQSNKLEIAVTKNQQIVNSKIENATFVISEPLPTLNLDISTEKRSYHVIAGAFRFPENAVKKVEMLKSEGYEAKILGINKWNLSVVSYGSYSTREEALEILSNIKSNVEKDSWLLIQNF